MDEDIWEDPIKTLSQNSNRPLNGGAVVMFLIFLYYSKLTSLAIDEL
jgi:hypothetical protein